MQSVSLHHRQAIHLSLAPDNASVVRQNSFNDFINTFAFMLLTPMLFETLKDAFHGSANYH